MCIFLNTLFNNHHQGWYHVAGGSPISKHESSAGECDSDERNPDIIPQPVDVAESLNYAIKKQHVSTIETSSSQNLLHQTGNSGYMGYCTLRNEMVLHTTESKLVRFHK